MSFITRGPDRETPTWSKVTLGILDYSNNPKLYNYYKIYI